jgi:hypothetical protein
MATYPRYWTKLPRQDFDAARPRTGGTKDAVTKARQIEKAYAPGHTGEPFIQLVEETETEYCVIAEWMPHRGCWDTPLGAGGFLPRAV